MAAVRPRKSPKTDAVEHAAKALDKTAELEVKYINSFKGRGVFAKAHFHKGDFVVEYRGELINSEESQRRRRTYHVRCTVFMFDFHWQERTWCIDAGREDGSLGRLVNDDHNHPNCKMKKVISEGKPHLCLFALRDINVGEEITYDYGGTDWPWRRKVGGPLTVTESSDADISRTKDQDPDRSSCSQNQVGGPLTVTESSDADISRTKDQDPDRSSCSQNQVGGPLTVTESSDADISRTKDQDPDRSSCSQNQVGGPLTVTESSDADISRTKDQDPDRSSCSQNQVGGPLTVTESSDADISRTKDQDPERSSCSQNQVGGPSTVTESSEDELSTTTDQDSERSSCSQNQGSDELGLNPPKNKVGMNQSCINYMDSNESHRSSSSPANFDKKSETWNLNSDSELSLSQHDEECVPRLRRNKSIQMKTQIHSDSDELFILTSAGSGEEYIPKTSEDYSAGTDTSKVLEPVEQKESMLRPLNFRTMDDIRQRGVSLTELNNGSSKNVVDRGRSPSRKGSSSGMRHKRRRLSSAPCPTTQTTSGQSSKQSVRGDTGTPLENSTPDLEKNHVQALCAFAAPPPPGVKVEFWKLLSNMVQDEAYFAVKSDVCIMEFGEHLYNRLGHDVGEHEYIRQKLRELGRLLVCSRKTTPLKTIQDHIKPVNFMHVVEAVKRVAGYDSETNAYKRPSLALKIGDSLTKISLLVERRANVQSDYSAAKDARTFRRVYETRWNELLSAASLRTLQESTWNAPLLLPFTKDVQTLHSYLDVQQQHSYSKLSTETSPQAWTQLAKVTLTQVILFNRQRAGEVSKMPHSAYLSQNPTDPDENVNIALSDLEKKLCQHFRRIELRGKWGRKVPVLLTPAMQQALDLLVSKREECGVPRENIYLFARPSAFTCYRGSDCLRHFAKVCGAKSPECLTSTKLRKQTGTLSQVLNFSNTELDQLADFLGCDIMVHRQFYRLPEGTLQLAKISKVLMALDQGRLAQFKGKSLNDISIDPDENVYMDSDTEVACEFDSQETQVTFSQREEDESTSPDVSQSDARSQQGPMTPHHQSPKRKRGRQPFKRKMWEKEEILAVEKHMISFITSCRLPGKNDCDKCLQQEKVALKNRNWLAIKFYIKNRITALKKTF
ncbi:uncharacterized protein LOC127357967 isoform X5 [Dicentrarchus labrax]|uniref:uncharacterized protein LOC127357967 isoform X5 n=1 Tax=Dicentrarchus labrax TaxID=13489 RepID=UPI0021F5A4D5|nr:uncharacterized protein LOC127357967 isoform X5 [Dicentrarchus labrax]